MRIFGFSVAIALFFAFASCDALADTAKPVADVHAAATHQVHPDARTKQTFDKTAASYMPRDLAQQVRADQLELNLIQEQVRARTEILAKRIDDILKEYGTQIQEIEFDTGAIHRAPKPPTPPAASPSKTPPIIPSASKK